MPDDIDGQDLVGGERPGVPQPDEVARSSAMATASPAAPPSPRSPSAPAPARPGYLIAMLCGGLVTVLAFLGLLQGLQATGRLPPPAISNNLCIDDKLRFMRDMPPADPNLLVVGSSVAWRGIDGTVLAKESPGTRPLNGGFCGLKANQTAFATEWLLRHYPGTRTILMLAVAEDFTGCGQAPVAVFDAEDADRYVFGGAWRWTYYFHYFDPLSLMHNAHNIAAQRANAIPLDPLVFTPTADGPLDTDVTRATLGYKAVGALDDGCFTALRAIASQAKAAGRRFVIVPMPRKPEWTTAYDADGRVGDAFALRLDQALASTGGERWDIAAQTQLPDAAFTDAIHLRWSAVEGLSQVLARHLLDHRS